MSCYYKKKIDMWHVRKMHQGINYHIGYFDTEEEGLAALANWRAILAGKAGTKDFTFSPVGIPKIKLTKFASMSHDQLKAISRQQVKDLSAQYSPKRTAQPA